MEWPYHKYDEDRKKILCGGGGGREEGSRSPPRNARRGRVTIGSPKGGDDPKGGGGGGGIGEDGLATIGVTAASVDVTYAIAGFGVAWCVRLVPIRPRSRCELHSLRTFAGASLRPHLAFNAHTSLSTSRGAFRFVSFRFVSILFRFCFDSIRFDSPLHPRRPHDAPRQRIISYLIHSVTNRIDRSVIDGSTDPTTAAWKAPVALLAGVVVGVVAGLGLGALFPRGDEDEDDDEDADGSVVNGSVVSDGDGSGSARPQNGDGSYRAAREDVDDARAFALLTTSQSILFLGSHLDATGGASVGVILASAFAARMYGDAASTRAEKPLAVIWSQARSIRRSPYDRVGAVNDAP